MRLPSYLCVCVCARALKFVNEIARKYIYILRINHCFKIINYKHDDGAKLRGYIRPI
jgi:hypothetical protein